MFNNPLALLIALIILVLFVVSVKKDKWGKIKKLGKLKYILSTTGLVVVLLGISIFIALANSERIEIKELYADAALLLIVIAACYFSWDYWENKFSKE